MKLQPTVRSYSDETRAYLLRRIEEISHGVARTAGMSEDRLPIVAIKDEFTPSVYNSPGLVARIVPLLKAGLGESAVIETPPVKGGEDFSRYGRTPEKVPGSLMWLGTVSEAHSRAAAAGKLNLPSLHSAKFAPEAKPAITTGVAGISAVILGLFASP